MRRTIDYSRARTGRYLVELIVAAYDRKGKYEPQ